jgi:hypothetical protein
MSRPPAYQLLRADCGRGIPLANGSIHAVVTSPPYFALRSYEGVSPTDWPELAYAPMPGLPPVVVPAMRCCLGAEPDPAAFVGHLVAIFDDVRRVMHKQSCAWVNLGDSYATKPAGNTLPRDLQPRSDRFNPMGMAACLNQLACKTQKPTSGLLEKNLLGVPWRFALAMQGRGWYLRSAPPWVKPGNAMPESCQDRPTTAHESLFMFTKSADYYFDMESVRRGIALSTVERDRYSRIAREGTKGDLSNAAGVLSRATLGLGGEHRGPKYAVAHDHETPSNPAGRSLRTADLFLDSLDDLIAWHRDRLDHLTRARQSGGLVASDADDPAAVLVNPEAFRGSHYAVMPSRLAEILVRCSTSEAGVCVTCGAPWERVVERESLKPVDYGGKSVTEDPHHPYRRMNANQHARRILAGDLHRSPSFAPKTLGWRPTCSCPPGPTRAAVVLDPFVGSGTTLVAALALERDALGLDASADYLRMAARRLDRPHARPRAEPADDGPGPLFTLEAP